MKTYSSTCFIFLLLTSCSSANFDIAQPLEISNEEVNDTYQNSDSGLLDSIGNDDSGGKTETEIKDDGPESKVIDSGFFSDTHSNDSTQSESSVDSGNHFYSCGKQDCSFDLHSGMPCCEGGSANGVCTTSCPLGRLVWCKKDSDCVDNYHYSIGYHCCSYSDADTCVEPGTKC